MLLHLRPTGTGDLIFKPFSDIPDYSNIMPNNTIALLEQALKKREALNDITNARRLVNGVGDKMGGLVLEQYHRHFVAQVFDPAWLSQKEALTNFVKARLGGEYFIVKDRTASSASSPEAFRKEVWIEGALSQTEVTEYGHKFSVELNDTLNSGLFLDMRQNRKLVGEMAKGRKVLNCFSYTCSFGVYCHALGAASVVNVDISQKALTRGCINYSLNKLPVNPDDFVRADAVEYLERAVKIDNRFGLIILDPPSFARYEGRTFRVKKDLQRLIELAFQALLPDGVLFVATNLSELTYDDLLDMVIKVPRQQRVRKIERLGQDVDFPGSGLMPESYLTAALVEL
jgi:23S rRNA G2069 N7-methylase RlmK/C1962 C5-methylase RlmI